MNNRKNVLCRVSVILILLCFNTTLFSQDYEIASPDGRIKIKIEISDKILYSVFRDSKEIIISSPVSLTVKGKGVLGREAEVTGTETRTVNEILQTVVAVKSREIADNFNEISIKFRGNFGLDFRAYNDGAAYRFNTDFRERIKIESEEAVFSFTKPHSIYYPTEESFLTHSERLYEYIPIRTVPPEKMCSMPVLIDIRNGPRIAITESDLRDYPGMYLRGDNNTSLYGLHPAFALKEKQTGDRTIAVTERADYIADTEGRR
ncbi:MAG: hypothetical protein GY863_07495, partial [bacterium]|nr:hypothetical protein [bacterium]